EQISERRQVRYRSVVRVESQRPREGDEPLAEVEQNDHLHQCRDKVDACEDDASGRHDCCELEEPDEQVEEEMARHDKEEQDASRVRIPV
ncbi:hypothetical protein PMAYCL1PPCAC_20770, partial [Pristionchus mayeri]